MISGGRPRAVFLHDADVVPGAVGALATLQSAADLDIPRHPGFGSDEDERSTEWDSVGDLAQYHLERIRASGDPRPVHLIGAGFGGWVALDMAVRCRELFASLTLVCPYGVKFTGPTEPEFADILLLDPDELVQLGWADPAACHSVRMPGFPADKDDELDERAFAERASLARYIWKPFLHDPRLRRWLGAVDVPALVVSGEQDRLVSAEHGRRLAQELPDAVHVTLARCGHYPYLETPQAFLAVVSPFICSGARPLPADEPGLAVEEA